MVLCLVQEDIYSFLLTKVTELCISKECLNFLSQVVASHCIRPEGKGRIRIDSLASLYDADIFIILRNLCARDNVEVASVAFVVKHLPLGDEAVVVILSDRGISLCTPCFFLYLPHFILLLTWQLEVPIPHVLYLICHR